ncbi:tripartite motif-containing protein 2-like [Saccostrea cucullata]|uniref:tripartite motif-containing protein 2-like n=1 Tax=Saccostrea cuccullata TaxID=36930 RepID=UPI002ED34691
MAAQSIVRNLSEEYLTCRVCLQSYDRPRRLPCQHSYCTDCIRQLIRTTENRRGKLTCPLCRSDVIVPNVSHDEFVNNLPLDSLIADLQITLSKHDQTPEITRADVCCDHSGKELDHYCFHHAQVICAKCIDTSHSGILCRCLPINESYRELQPRIERVLKRLHLKLNDAEVETIHDRSFEESKQKTLDEIANLEKGIENIFETCRRQISVLRSDIQKLNREYLSKRKDFFHAVNLLLETTSHIECLKKDKKYKHLIELLPIIENQLETNFDTPTSKTASLKLTLYDEVKEFLRGFSAVGFVELKGVRSDLDTDFSDLQLKTNNSSAPPLSISHILNRIN